MPIMSNGFPMVSIIIPAYNVEGYIARALESMQRQTFTDYELFVVNDGSTDRTGDIGDGKIFIYNVEDVVKVRTGETGYDAMQDVE